MLGGRGEFLLVEGPHGLEERDPMYSDHPSFPDPWKPELAERVRGFEPATGLLALYNGVDARFTVYDDAACVDASCERVGADAVLPPWVAQDRRFREHLVVWSTGRYRILQTASQFRDQPHMFDETLASCGLPTPEQGASLSESLSDSPSESGGPEATAREEDFELVRSIDGAAWTVVALDLDLFGGNAQLVSADGLRSPVLRFDENPPYCSHFVSLGEDDTRFAARVRFSNSAFALPAEGLGVLWQWVLYERDGDTLRPTGAVDEARCWFFSRDGGRAEVRREVTFTQDGISVGETEVIESPGSSSFPQGPWLFFESGPGPRSL